MWVQRVHEYDREMAMIKEAIDTLEDIAAKASARKPSSRNSMDPDLFPFLFEPETTMCRNRPSMSKIVTSSSAQINERQSPLCNSPGIF